jgi:hypothetical protein
VRALRALGLCVMAAALAWSTPAAAGTSPDEMSAPARVRLLDVPYVPQSGVLCGGAALAMVLRYWGMTGVLAEDFAALVETGEAGIRTGALVKAAAGHGWTALALPGTPTEIRNQLALGRPVIALIRSGSDSYHYVVLVAWANGWVVVHDPNVGPLRVVREADFDAAWSESGAWALLVLPPPEAGEAGEADPATPVLSSPAAADGCGALVEAGILLAGQGNVAEAELRFLAAQSLCPLSAAPLRERAGLRFRAEDWPGASRLAERALALDPDDDHTRRLLAGSRFLAGDVEGALRAWNRLSEPRTDLARIDGLGRIRYAAVAGQLDLSPGRLLTAPAFRLARRRLTELPALADFRLSLQPLAGGSARVDVILLERPLLFADRWDVGRAVLRAAIGREAALEVASLTGNGELWSAAWRWWEERPRVSLALAVPLAGGHPGLWRVEGLWERQAYAARARSDASDTTRARVIREERRRAALSFATWLGPDLRCEVGAARDEWTGHGACLSLEGAVETRRAGDRLALGAAAARWMSLGHGAPFGTGALSLRWCSDGLENGEAWRGGLGISRATSAAPLALWSGAGTGYGRNPLLRAHPLLDGGVVRGRVFGRTLVHGTIERQAWPWTVGPLRLGWALFIDAARPWDTGGAGRMPWQVDGGTGLRLRSPGLKGQLRVDAAHGFADGNTALSVGWLIP